MQGKKVVSFSFFEGDAPPGIHVSEGIGREAASSGQHGFEIRCAFGDHHAVHGDRGGKAIVAVSKCFQSLPVADFGNSLLYPQNDIPETERNACE